MGFRYMSIVFKKELKDTFRDKKTIFTSIIIPIIIFPVLAFVIGIGTSGLMDEGSKPLDIAIIYEEDNQLVEYLENNENVNIKNTDDSYKALNKLDVKVILKIEKGFDANIKEGKLGKVELIYDESSQKSDIAFSRLLGIIKDYSQAIAYKRLEQKGINPSILTPIEIKENSIAKEDGLSMAIFAMILPFMLTIWSAVGGIPAATDLGAGEKERQTLEPLLTTKASRMSILLGKYFTVVVAGIMGTLASLIGFLIASKINPNFMGAGVMLPALSIVVIALFCLGLALVFAGLELVVSFYARNFKEAQTYLSPLTIVLMVPAYLTMFLDGRSIPEKYFHIPVINTIAIIKEAIVPIINFKHIVIVILWSIVYVGLSLFITIKMFNKESVIFRS